MEKNYEFTIGQRVKQNDPDDGIMCYGKVVDKTSDKVFIQWEDLSEPAEHERFEFPTIHLDTRKP